MSKAAAELRRHASHSDCIADRIATWGMAAYIIAVGLVVFGGFIAGTSKLLSLLPHIEIVVR